MEHAAPLRVEVRRPLYRPNPFQRFRQRWRARRARRNDDDGDSNWWELASVPVDVGGAIGFAIAAVVVLVVGLVVFGPGIWLLVVLLAELGIWLLFGGGSLVAWLVLGQPWHVTVVGDTDAELAEVSVRGRRRAHEHAEVVRARLRSGASPDAAVMLP